MEKIKQKKLDYRSIGLKDKKSKEIFNQICLRAKLLRKPLEEQENKRLVSSMSLEDKMKQIKEILEQTE